MALFSKLEYFNDTALIKPRCCKSVSITCEKSYLIAYLGVHGGNKFRLQGYHVT